MQTDLMGMLNIPILCWATCFSYNPTQTMWVFIIHTFVLHAGNMFPGGCAGGGCAGEINNSDKSCLVRGEERG